MNQLKPKIAAELAREAYFVQDEFTIEAILARPEFSQKSSDRHHLKAEVGSRLINTLDGFGICAVGGKGTKMIFFLFFPARLKRIILLIGSITVGLVWNIPVRVCQCIWVLIIFQPVCSLKLKHL